MGVILENQFSYNPFVCIDIQNVSVIQINVSFLLATVVMTLKNLNSLFIMLTPKITIEAPERVAVCPPLGLGLTPSIKGLAHCHFLGLGTVSVGLCYAAY